MVENHENIYKSRKRILADNFLGGIAWGLGVTIGLTVFFAVLAFIGRNIDLVPVVGEFVANVINYIVTNSGQLPGR
jgi:hypothetical protein